jgi:SAM-dependent methyltransferase
MEVHNEELSDVTRYIEGHRTETLEDKIPEFNRLMKYAGKYKTIEPGMDILEIGIGCGSVPILCKMKGLHCLGLEISPQLVEYARSWGRALGAEPDVEVANIETSDIGEARYDVIFCSNVFEHIEYWQLALEKVYRALKPGGVLFFESTSKFSFVSGEYDFPLYGWLPNQWRYNLRQRAQSPDIMKLGIDFNQFTHPGLRRAFKRAGFREWHDVFDLIDTSTPRSAVKRAIIALGRNFRPFRELVLCFHIATTYVCVK